MSGLVSTARQEVVSLRRERLPQVLLVVFVVMVSVSSLIGWLTNSTVSQVWEATKQAGLTQAPNPFATVSALFYARNTVIYIVLIGALMAIVVGVGSALRDRKAHTVDLVLSRPISVWSYLAGKLAGIALWMCAVLAAVAVISWVSIAVIIGQPLSLLDSARLATFFAVALVFLLGFVLLGMISGIYSSRETTALLVPISVWSVIAFILPQLGTAAHPVSLLNPVPAIATDGGPFTVLNTVLGPLSVTEQFKTASALILANTDVEGSLPVSLFALTLVLVLGTVLLMATNRDRLRRELRE